MRLITSEIGHINRLVCLSKAAFDSDVSVGAPCPDGPRPSPSGMAEAS